MEKETIILEFQIDEKGAINDLERTKTSIVLLKEEQKKLNDAYKKGSISLEEYASESVRVEQILKKESNTYSTLTKQVQGHVSQTDKLIASNEKLAKANTNLAGKFQDVAGNINIAGTNLGSLTSGMSAFLNPVTAAVGVVSSLATAYFTTGRGAQDLEAIQFKLSATSEVLSNKVADLVDKFKEIGGEEGGIADYAKAAFNANPIVAGLRLQFELLDKATGGAFSSTGDEIDKLAELKKTLDDLNQAQTRARITQTNLLEDNADLSEKISREQTNYNDKIFLSNQMIDNVRQGSKAVLDIKEQELAALNELLLVNKNSEALQRQIADKELEISQERRKEEKLVNSIQKLQDNINTAEDASLKKLADQLALQQQIEEHLKAQLPEDVSISDINEIRQEEVNILDKKGLAQQQLALSTQVATEATKREAAANKEAAKAMKESAAADDVKIGRLLILSNSIGGASAIFEKHTIASKTLSAVQAGINSYLAGTEVLKDPALIGRPLFRGVAMFATIAAGLAQQQKILGSFGGGGDFVTKGPTWLLVGDNPGGKERVNVTPVSGRGQTKILDSSSVAMAGGGSINGSIQAMASTNMIDQTLGLQSATQDAKVILDYSEFTRFTSQVEFKETVTKA